MKWFRHLLPIQYFVYSHNEVKAYLACFIITELINAGDCRVCPGSRSSIVAYLVSLKCFQSFIPSSSQAYRGLIILLFKRCKIKYTYFFTRTLAYAHSRTRSLAMQTSFDSYAHTDIQRMRFSPNCNTSPVLAGPVGSTYEDYSETKNTEEKFIKVKD